MGLFKDLAKLHQQGKEISAGWDPAAQMREASAAMTQAQAMMDMGAQRATGTAAMSGTPTTATLSAVSHTGQMYNHAPVLKMDLLVMMNGIPTPVTVSEVVPLHLLAKAQVGNQIRVKVGATPEDLYLDWVGS